MLTVADVMDDELITVSPEWTVSRVTTVLLDEDVASLWVTDGQKRLIGMVCESVLLLASVDPQLRSDPISLHMQRKFASVAPSDPIGQVVEKFLLHRVPQFPVTAQGKLVGKIGRRDVMRGLLGESTKKTASQG